MKNLIFSIVISIFLLSGIAMAEIKEAVTSEVNTETTAVKQINIKGIRVREVNTNRRLAAAETLLEAMDLEASIEELIEKMLQLKIEADPDSAGYKQVITSYYGSKINSNIIRNEIIALYADSYTEKELNEMTTHLQSSIGRKTISEMPKVLEKAAKKTLYKLQDNKNELQNAIQKEKDRVKELYGQ